MARLPHDGVSPVSGNVVVKFMARLHFRDDCRSLVVAQNVAREEHHDFVTENRMRALFVNEADAIGVAVESEPEVGFFFFHGFDQVFQDSPARSDRDDGSGSGRQANRTAR